MDSGTHRLFLSNWLRCTQPISNLKQPTTKRCRRSFLRPVGFIFKRIMWPDLNFAVPFSLEFYMLKLSGMCGSAAAVMLSCVLHLPVLQVLATITMASLFLGPQTSLGFLMLPFVEGQFQCLLHTHLVISQFMVVHRSVALFLNNALTSISASSFHNFYYTLWLRVWLRPQHTLLQSTAFIYTYHTIWR